MTRSTPDFLRRRMLGALAALPVVPHAYAQSALRLTPECRGQAKPTPQQTAGPFYTPRSPQRASLVESGSKAARLVLAGRVVSPQCRPVGKALLDFWHCDEHGAYDNDGYRYRGHVFADADGRFRIETIVPAVYPGRARHIHVKVQPPGGRVLTTQLYFPGDASNQGDFGWRRDLELAYERREGTALGAFQFVVEA
jgi:protocatechuate 3,4-dioxygenase beta subunit